MTASELIAILSTMPPDADVFIESSDWEYPPTHIHKVQQLVVGEPLRLHH